MSAAAATHGRIVQLSRIRKEIADLTKNKRAFIKEFRKCEPCRDIFQFKISGDTELYKDFVFTLTIDISLDYPFRAPFFKFSHPVFHPNVDPKSYELCSPTLLQENWKPETTMEDIILNWLVLLNEPDLSRPINFEAATDYMKDKAVYMKKFHETAKKWKSGEK
uniref:UBIQUITIN_CONJUGAT_2 domain-containing protein n=1 Tax=Caenorhabditis tropicalis TaxID=1561998 RepID=A0A1I7UDJ9_9PELO